MSHSHHQSTSQDLLYRAPAVRRSTPPEADSSLPDELDKLRVSSESKNTAQGTGIPLVKTSSSSVVAPESALSGHHLVALAETDIAVSQYFRSNAIL